MTDTVELMVVGVTGDTSRKDLLQKLVAEFKQDGSAFEPLLDAAYGESAPYAAQSGVSVAMAEEGKQQLEKLGLVCSIGSKDAVQAASVPVADTGPATVSDTSAADTAELAIPEPETEETSETDDLSFEPLEDSGVIEEPENEISDNAAETELEEFELPETNSEAPEPEQAAEEKADSKSDVPTALAGASFDELQAELIDPEPAKKAKKEPVALDDGGLSLSEDDSAPLTAQKAKSNPDAASDGGLTLAVDGETDFADLTEAESSPEAEASEKAKEDDVSFEALPEENAEKPVAAKSEEIPEEVSFDALEIEGDTAEAPDTTETPLEALAEEQSDEVNTAEIEAVETDTTEVESEEAIPDEAVAAADDDSAPVNDPLGNILADINTKTDSAPAVSNSPEIGQAAEASTGGLVLPGQLEANTIVPNITPEDEISDDLPSSVVTNERVPTAAESEELTTMPSEELNPDLNEELEFSENSGKSKKKLVAALAGALILAGGGTFAFMNAGSLLPSGDDDMEITVANATPNDRVVVKPVDVTVGDLISSSNLEQLSTEELLVNLSATSDSTSIVNLEPYFLESVTRTRSAPRFGAAVPAESESMVGVENRVPHPADKYFDDWSTREADLSLFLSLMDDLIDKGELEVAQQLSDRAKDKLFAVMSSQRLARAYSDVGQNTEVAMLMKRAARETFAVKSPEERVLAISDYGLTEQAIGLNEEAIDTFLTASILARSLSSPEMKAVGLSSAARYFQRSGREAEAQELLTEAMQAGMDLPKSAAARDLAVRYVALSEARMGLFNQALDHTKLIADPFASVSAYHGIALAIERSGDENNARKVLNMAYRAGSNITNKEERSKLLSKVVLADEMD